MKFHSLMLFLGIFVFSSLVAENVSEIDITVEELSFEVNAEETIGDVLEKIESLAELSKEVDEPFILVGRWDSNRERIVGVDFVANSKSVMVQQHPVDVQRDYNQEVSVAEKNDITFIVTTLANATLTKIWRSKSALERAGDRIDHIHPLKFLMALFTDERLKVGLHVIKTRGWVWKDFFAGIRDSLSDENRLCNMPLDYIQDFASRVGIDVSLIFQPIQDGRWSDFVDILIKYIPRSEDGRRYDI
ncbi:MAG: hypothetical protein P4L16_03525 [Chlamydiales bacterium]|nr:hypothetical protein [Chlamydiales bacterium]